MKATHSRALVGLALAIGLAAAFLAATLGALAAAQPVAAQAVARLHERAGLRLAPAAETVSMAQVVQTNSGDNSIAFNGQTITYTLIITNNSLGNQATNVVVLDTLPAGTLDHINCPSPCQPIFDQKQVPEPLGGTLLVTVTKFLSWTVPVIGPLATTQLVFSARVTGQPDGSTFTNSAFASYNLNGSPGVVSPPDATTTARAQIGQTGQSSLASAPTWLSNDLGGTLSQDWGDFNHDGQLDLVLGSSLGPSVYVNQGGQLKPYGTNPISQHRTYGVRWADLNHDGKLEIVAVGDSISGTAVTSGTTYLYGPVPGGFVQIGSFVTDYQMVRVAVGDFTGDGNVDIIESTNTLNAPCPVELFVNDGKGNFARSPNCVSHNATAALGAADVENNGRLDLAVGLFPNVIEVLLNDGTGNFNSLPPIVVDNNVPFLPYDFAWGDFDGNGLLDLAAAFPLQKEARVYRNLGGGVFLNDLLPFRTTKFLSPLSVAWGDFNGDGALDLAVGDESPKIYLNNKQGGFDLDHPLVATAVAGQVWSLRSAQIADNSDVNLSLTDRDGPSLLFDSFGGKLATNLTHFNGSSQPATGVALGDANSDGTIDLLLGAAPLSVQGAVIDYNVGATFANQLNLQSGPGPQSVALGDVNGDGQLDVAIGTAVNAQLFLAGQTVPVWTASAPNGANHIVAFCDVNSDGRLDLLVGANGAGVAVYLNQSGTFPTTPSFVTAETGNVKAIACADFQRNHYPGFAVAFNNQPLRLYQNNKNGTFTSLWNSITTSQTTSLAWGDFNRDGYPDLAVGNFEQGTQIYENYHGILQPTPIWSSPTQWRTTSLAWGDWNNDGLLDLAIGNDNQPVQVFGNLGSSPGQARLFWVWTSADTHQTTGVAWGDFSGDGHLDLAISEQGNCSPCNGYYPNGSIAASHLNGNYLHTLTLPNNPSYLYVKRPGTTADGYANSSAEVLGGPPPLPLTVTYTMYDPNGSRAISNAVGNPIGKTFFDYSLDGGSTWLTATAAAGWTGPVTTTSRYGQSATFPWDITKDKAISDDARFRVRIVPIVPVGPVENASATAVSPPFIVRGTTCQWPENPSITVSQNPISPTVPAGFFGSVLAGTGALTYTWNFGDGITATEQVAQHAFTQNGLYTVTLTVSGEPCPQNRDVVATLPVLVGSGPGSNIYLPMVADGPVAEGLAAPNAGSTPAVPHASVAPHSEGRPQVNADPIRWLTRQTPVGLANNGPAETPVQVTTSTVGINNQPSLNGDGTRIAFWSTANPTGKNGDGSIEAFLLITDTGGVTITQITSSTGSILGGFNLSPSIDEAGDRVVFFSDRDLVGQNSDNSFQIFLYDVATQVLTQVTHTTKGFNILPSISRDGRFIAFASDRNFVGQNADANTEIFRAQILPGGGINFIQVTSTTGGTNDQPQINGDGTRITFVSDQDLDPVHGDNSLHLREVFLAGIGPGGQAIYTQISHTGSGTTGDPSIDGDGQRVAFISDRSPITATDINPNQFREVFYADVDTSDQVTITKATTSTSDVGIEQPSISTDGTRIGFISPGNSMVRVFDTLLGKELTATVATPLNPSLSGDGTALAFAFNQQLYLTSHRLTKLTISKTASAGPIFQDQPFSYTVVLTNSGPSAAANVLLTDTLSAIPGANPGWVMSDPVLTPAAEGTCSPAIITATTPITCTIPSLPAKTKIIMTIGLTPTTYGPLTNTVSYSTDTLQRLSSLGASVNLTIQPLPVASVNITLTGPTTGTAYVPNTFIASVSPVTASLPLTYVWQVSNQPIQGQNQTLTFTSTVVSSTQVFTWNPGGVQFITVTVDNAAVHPVSNTAVITIANPLPVLTSTLPITALVDGPPVTLNLTGAGFVANSSVLWNNKPLSTTFVTSASLSAIVPTASLAPTGPYTVAVFNQAPEGGLSNVMTVTVENPNPVLTSLQPITAARGAPDLVLTVNGSSFVNGASLFFGSQPSLTTSLISSSQLTTTVPASYLLQPAGPATITVTNPSPSVGPSNGLPFTLTTPTLSLTLSPPSIDVSQTTTLTLIISDLQAASRVITLISSNPAVASLPPTITLPAGTASVTTTVQGGGVGGFVTITGTLPAAIGGQSSNALLTVRNLQPVIAALSPVTTTAGGPAFTLTLTGSNFVSGATLVWDSQAVVLNLFGSGGTVTTTIPAGYIATAGSVPVTVNNPAPNDGPSNTVAFTVTNPLPAITSVQPTPISVTVPVTLDVTGLNFASNATVEFNGQVLSQVQILSSTQLTASVPASLFPIAADYTLTVTNPPPGGGLVTTTVTAVNPVPIITAVIPPTITAGATGGTLFIAGSRYVSGTSTVDWDGSPRPTVFFSSTLLGAATNTSDLVSPAIITITVVNSAPVGGVSNVVPLTITTSQPTITAIQPTTVQAAGPVFTLVVTGTNFVTSTNPAKDSTIQINGANISPTNFVSSTVLTATVDPSVKLSTGGIYTVTVLNPDPDGGNQLSNGALLTATNPAPSITAMSPTFATAGDVTTTLTVTGSNFAGGGVSTVLWNGITTLSTGFVSSTRLTATLAPAQLATAGLFPVTVNTAGPGGGTASPALTFTVNNPAPFLQSLSPISQALPLIGRPITVRLVVTGTNFVANAATINWSDGVIITPLATTTVSPISVKGQIDVSVAGIYTVTVTNPPPPAGGITSTNALTVAIYNPQPILKGLSQPNAVAGTNPFSLTLQMQTASFAPAATGRWNGADRPTSPVDNTHIVMTVLASDLANVGTDTITVHNPDPSLGDSTGLPFQVTTPTVTLAPANPPTIILTNTGTLTATISDNQFASTVISLTSSDPSVASVPATVNLPANTGSVSFTLTTHNISGTATITAQLPGPLGGDVSNAVNVTVHDASITGLKAINSSPTPLGSATSLTATITTGSNVSYTWSLGDGTGPTALTTTNSVAHTYPVGIGGFYTAVVTATNPIGTLFTASTVITIENLKPVITTVAPPSPLISNTTTPITVTGSNYVTGTVIKIQLQSGGPITTYVPSSVTATQIKATISGTDIGKPGNYNLWVFVPDPAVANLSDPFAFTVQ